MNTMDISELHLCQCGCGQKTSLAKQHDKRKGWIKGSHVRFIQGHGARRPYWRFALPGEKVCAKCKTSKATSEFHKSGKGRLHHYCKKCSNEYNRNRNKLKPAGWKDWKFRNLYKITYEQYAEMVRSQNGACAICKKVPEKRRLAVDHCHSSGKIRGLLCTKCNSMIGFCGDDLLILEAAVKYLQRP